MKRGTDQMGEEVVTGFSGLREALKEKGMHIYRTFLKKRRRKNG
jgi:hypothetical protein